MNYSNLFIDELLVRFKPLIGADYNRYRNHVYRVFLNCQLLDDNKREEEKYAIAAVFHDIGIWTNHTFDYLQPSIAQLKIYFLENDKLEWFDELSKMIYWHHKISAYKGEHVKTVEVFRKADWIDVSLGVLSFGCDKQKIREYKRQFPNHGFHWFLVKQTAKNFLRHPLNPIPVFKK